MVNKPNPLLVIVLIIALILFFIDFSLSFRFLYFSLIILVLFALFESDDKIKVEHFTCPQKLIIPEQNVINQEQKLIKPEVKYKIKIGKS